MLPISGVSVVYYIMSSLLLLPFIDSINQKFEYSRWQDRHIQMEDTLQEVADFSLKQITRKQLSNHSEIIQNDVAVHLSKYPKPAG